MSRAGPLVRGAVSTSARYKVQFTFWQSNGLIGEVFEHVTIFSISNLELSAENRRSLVEVERDVRRGPSFYGVGFGRRSFFALQDSLLQRTSSILQLFCMSLCYWPT